MDLELCRKVRVGLVVGNKENENKEIAYTLDLWYNVFSCGISISVMYKTNIVPDTIELLRWTLNSRGHYTIVIVMEKRCIEYAKMLVTFFFFGSVYYDSGSVRLCRLARLRIGIGTTPTCNECRTQLDHMIRTNFIHPWKVIKIVWTTS